MSKSKLKNKINKKTGNFICNNCGEDAGAVSVLMCGRVYCLKCEAKTNAKG